MNYPLKFELERIGSWSCIDIRLGSYQCSCKCNHGKTICEHCSMTCTVNGYYKSRPSTIYEKLVDCSKILKNLDDWVKFHDYEVDRHCRFLKYVKWEEEDDFANWQELYKKLDWLRWLNCSLHELRVAHSILKHQVKAYRRILFPDEKKLLYNYCGICQEKRFFYRIPNLEKYYFPKTHFDFNYKNIGYLFHCSKCHLVCKESDIGKMNYVESSKRHPFFQNVKRYNDFMGEIILFKRPLDIQKYYREHELYLKNLPVDQFFIVKDEKYFCIACGCYYKRKYDAQRHMNKFWIYSNLAFNSGCQKGIFRMLKQKAETT